ncbi:PQQ-dependent sugar dehydrogenase, partial [Xanthomonas phaseoli]
PAESARNGEIPKFQKPLFGTTPPSALSGLVVQTFPNGDNYDGTPIPDHNTRPEFAAPKISWTPVISPAGFVIYSGKQFPAWRGNGFIGGLSSMALVQVSLGDQPREVARYDMGARIREVEQGPDGALWLLEDEASGSTGRLLKLTPKSKAAVENDA